MRAIGVLPLLWVALPLGQAPAQAAHEGPGIRAVAGVSLTVSDLERSIAFFTEVLDCELLERRELAGAAAEAWKGVFGLRLDVARLRLGAEELELIDFLVPEGRLVPADSRSNDRWFQHVAIVVSDVERAYAHLRRHKVKHASSGPQRLPDWNPNAGGIEAFYFKDPDDHVLEIIRFPPGKGDPKWRLPAAGDRLFLGIDHTAIVVQDTEASLAFYRDLLGMRVAGESENYGSEQEHLNNVFGSRLRITALRAAEGPGVELLQYLAPSGGRPYPPDAQSNDLVHWETRFQAVDLEGLARRLREAKAPFLSAGPAGSPAGATAVVVRDPDGHAISLSQSPASAGK